jgi:hypothetical protein
MPSLNKMPMSLISMYCDPIAGAEVKVNPVVPLAPPLLKVSVAAVAVDTK